jgi:hypothetical protein
MYCHRHPSTPATVACGRCEQRICSYCMVSSSAGMRCPDCAFSKPVASTTASKLQPNTMSAFAGLLTGLAGAYVIALVAYVLPLLTLVLAPFYGRFVADSVLSFAGNTLGRKIEAIGVGSVLLGAVVATGTPIGTTHIIASVSLTELSQAIVGLSIGVAVAVCYHRLKQSPS